MVQSELLPALGPKSVASASNVVNFLKIENIARITTLTFTVDVVLVDGTKETRDYSISVSANNNNIDGRFVFVAGHDLAGYTLIFDVKGNGGNIKALTLR